MARIFGKGVAEFFEVLLSKGAGETAEVAGERAAKEALAEAMRLEAQAVARAAKGAPADELAEIRARAKEIRVGAELLGKGLPVSAEALTAAARATVVGADSVESLAWAILRAEAKAAPAPVSLTRPLGDVIGGPRSQFSAESRIAAMQPNDPGTMGGGGMSDDAFKQATRAEELKQARATTREKEAAAAIREAQAAKAAAQNNPAAGAATPPPPPTYTSTFTNENSIARANTKAAIAKIDAVPDADLPAFLDTQKAAYDVARTEAKVRVDPTIEFKHSFNERVRFSHLKAKNDPALTTILEARSKEFETASLSDKGLSEKFGKTKLARIEDAANDVIYTQARILKESGTPIDLSKPADVLQKVTAYAQNAADDVLNSALGKIGKNKPLTYHAYRTETEGLIRQADGRPKKFRFYEQRVKTDEFVQTEVPNFDTKIHEQAIKESRADGVLRADFNRNVLKEDISSDLLGPDLGDGQTLTRMRTNPANFIGADLGVNPGSLGFGYLTLAYKAPLKTLDHPILGPVASLPYWCVQKAMSAKTAFGKTLAVIGASIGLGGAGFVEELKDTAAARNSGNQAEATFEFSDVALNALPFQSDAPWVNFGQSTAGALKNHEDLKSELKQGGLTLTDLFKAPPPPPAPETPAEQAFREAVEAAEAAAAAKAQTTATTTPSTTIVSPTEIERLTKAIEEELKGVQK